MPGIWPSLHPAFPHPAFRTRPRLFRASGTAHARHHGTPSGACRRPAALRWARHAAAVKDQVWCRYPRSVGRPSRAGGRTGSHRAPPVAPGTPDPGARRRANGSMAGPGSRLGGGQAPRRRGPGASAAGGSGCRRPATRARAAGQVPGSMRRFGFAGRRRALQPRIGRRCSPAARKLTCENRKTPWSRRSDDLGFGDDEYSVLLG